MKYFLIAHHLNRSLFSILSFTFSWKVAQYIPSLSNEQQYYIQQGQLSAQTIRFILQFVECLYANYYQLT